MCKIDIEVKFFVSIFDLKYEKIVKTNQIPRFLISSFFNPSQKNLG